MKYLQIAPTYPSPDSKHTTCQPARLILPLKLPSLKNQKTARNPPKFKHELCEKQNWMMVGSKNIRQVSNLATTVLSAQYSSGRNWEISWNKAEPLPSNRDCASDFDWQAEVEGLPLVGRSCQILMRGFDNFVVACGMLQRCGWSPVGCKFDEALMIYWLVIKGEWILILFVTCS